METYNPFLKVERVRRRGLGADVGRPEAGVALVLVGRDGKLTVLRPGDWLTLRGYLAGYAEVYTVDLGEHLLEWTAELPSHEDAFTFTATFALTCWITDPAAVVRQRIEDVGLLLWAEVERQARAVTRDFRLFDIGEAGQAIVKRLAGAVLHPAFGTRVSVTLSPPPLDQLSRQLGIRVPPAKRMLAHRGLSRVPVHVYARMDSELVVDQVASVQVIVSREAIRHVSQPTEVSGQAKADPERSIVVEVIGRTNLVAIIRNRQEVPIPAPNEPRLLLFDVRVTHSGEGELWVVARQGPLPLLTLVLRPRLRTEPSSAGPMSQAFASGEAVLGTPDTPLTVLRIHEERHGDAVIYRYDLDSPELGFTRAYASRLIKQDRDAYVRGLFQRIETAWIASGEDSAAFQEQLRAFGAELLDELVPMELQGDLWAHRDQVAHIVVLSTEPFIPWELVHLKDPAAGRLPDQTRFLAQLGLVRWLWQPQQSGRHSNIRLPQRLSLRPGQARYIIPDYPDPAWRLTALAAEQAFLERHLHAAPVTPTTPTYSPYCGNLTGSTSCTSPDMAGPPVTRSATLNCCWKAASNAVSTSQNLYPSRSCDRTSAPPTMAPAQSWS